MDAELTADDSLQALTAYFPPPALTSTSHPLAPGREWGIGEVESLTDAGRKMDSSVFSTESF